MKVLAKSALLRAWLLRPLAALGVRVRHRPAVARPAPPPRPRAPELAAHQLMRMRAALSAVLEHHPRVRRVLPSLVAIERALTRGSYALECLPLLVRDASSRLDALVGDWSSESLRQLRDHLRCLCELPAAAARETSAQPDRGGDIEVSETSLSRFLEAGQMLDR